MTVTPVTDEWLLPVEAARRLGISSDALFRLRRSGALPARTLPGCQPRYRADDVARLAAEADRAGGRAEGEADRG